MSSQNENGIANENANGKRSITRMFGARRVFVFYLTCLIITVGTMIASIITSLMPDVNTVEMMVEHLFLCAGALILLTVPLAMHSKYNFHIPWYLSMSIGFMILAHFVLGEIYRFYDHVFLFDKFLHLSGGLVIAACGFSIVYGFSKDDSGVMKLSPFFAGLFSFSFTVMLLVVWEIFEYYVDTLGGYNMQRWGNSLVQLYSDVASGHITPNIEYFMHEHNGNSYWLTSVKRGGGLIDTMNDLIIGSIGAAVVSIICALSFKKNPSSKAFLIMKKNTVKMDTV